MYRPMSRVVSFQACLSSSLSSKTVDSQSFASEKEVILIMSSLRSMSGSEGFFDVGEGDLEVLDPPPVLVGVLGILSLRKAGNP
jgi:hypothetical protein